MVAWVWTGVLVFVVTAFILPVLAFPILVRTAFLRTALVVPWTRKVDEIVVVRESSEISHGR